MRKVLTFSVLLMFGLAVAGCSKKNVQDGSVEVEDAAIGSGQVSASGLGQEGDASGVGVGGSTMGGEGATGMEGDMGDPLSKRVVYFEFDSSVLTPEAQQIVEAHANYLANNPGLALVLEGHADERGTREYNLALGERRANSVAQLMQGLGVGGDSIRSISYGEERPVALGSDESSWSLNRRVEILY